MAVARGGVSENESSVNLEPASSVGYRLIRLLLHLSASWAPAVRAVLSQGLRLYRSLILALNSAVHARP
jgi:hypothetical protein